MWGGSIGSTPGRGGSTVTVTVAFVGFVNHESILVETAFWLGWLLLLL